MVSLMKNYLKRFPVLRYIKKELEAKMYEATITKAIRQRLNNFSLAIDCAKRDFPQGTLI